jgi:hypothetical protein
MRWRCAQLQKITKFVLIEDQLSPALHELSTVPGIGGYR